MNSTPHAMIASPEAAVVPAQPLGEEPAGMSDDYAAIELTLDISFEDRALLRSALTHPSYANEHPEDPTEHNERLEFLGDAVLGMIVARTLYQRYPDVAEGRLTEWRAHLVCGPTLARVAMRLGLGSWLRLGRGEDQTGGREREGNLERGFEAVVGAIYLDVGLETARAFVRRALAEELATLEQSPDELNPKGALQELAQGLIATGEVGGRPEYVLRSESGPDHERSYEVEVQLDGEVLGQGSGGSKQQAEKEAAAQALAALRLRLDRTDPRVDPEDGGGHQATERGGGS